MKIWINNDISVETVTAVPCIEGEYDENNRQPALYIVEYHDIETVETVVFGGCEAPTTTEELEGLWKSIDWYEADTNWETIETIRR